jgi:hypothetical protein
MSKKRKYNVLFWTLVVTIIFLPYIASGLWLSFLYVSFDSHVASDPSAGGIFGWMAVPATFMAMPWVILTTNPIMIPIGLFLNGFISFGIFVGCKQIVSRLLKAMGLNVASNDYVTGGCAFLIQSALLPTIVATAINSFDSIKIFNSSRTWILQSEEEVSLKDAKKLCTNMSDYFFEIPDLEDVMKTGEKLANSFQATKIFVFETNEFKIYNLTTQSVETQDPLNESNVASPVCVCRKEFSDKINCSMTNSLMIPGKKHVTL